MVRKKLTAKQRRDRTKHRKILREVSDRIEAELLSSVRALAVVTGQGAAEFVREPLPYYWKRYQRFLPLLEKVSSNWEGSVISPLSGEVIRSPHEYVRELIEAGASLK